MTIEQAAKPAAHSPWSKVLTVLQGASLLVGIALGLLALWPQIKPKDELFVEVLTTDARLPAELVNEIRSLPTAMKTDLLEDEKYLALLKDRKIREAIAGRIEERLAAKIAASTYVGDLFADFFGKGLLVITIQNKSDRPIRDIRLARRFGALGDFTLVSSEGKVEPQSSKLAALGLGDMPARTHLQLFFWGLTASMSGPDDFIVSHEGGVAEVFGVVAAPELVWRHQGVFFSYAHTTYFLLGLLLIGASVAGFALRRGKQRRP